MPAALRQLDLSQVQYERVIAVAASVARLAGVKRIGPVHLAEAIQYRSRV
jgi:magnesium chelatase family protein